MADDFEMFWCDLNQNVFHGSTGERAVVASVGALSSGRTTITFDDEWGVKHLNEGGVYVFYSSAGALRGSANGYPLYSKDPESKIGVFTGDLTGLSIAEDDIELSMAELDEASWARPGTTAAAKLPATSRAPIKASSFFMVLLREGLLAR